MFLKRLERRKTCPEPRRDGKGHTYWALVESYRTKGSRPRVVAYLGELKKSERNGWAPWGRRLDGPSRPQPSLFDPPGYDDPSDDKPVLCGVGVVENARPMDAWGRAGRCPAHAGGRVRQSFTTFEDMDQERRCGAESPAGRRSRKSHPTTLRDPAGQDPEGTASSPGFDLAAAVTHGGRGRANVRTVDEVEPM